MFFLLLIAQLTYVIDARNNGFALVNIAKQIESCTSPEGKCYKEGQASQVKAISNLNQVSVLAAFCASRIPPPVSATEVSECVKKELNK